MKSKSTHGGPRPNTWKKSKLSANTQAYIRSNYNRMSSPEMAKNLNFKCSTVTSFLQKYKLVRTHKNKHKKDRSIVVKGFFNVDEFAKQMVI